LPGVAQFLALGGSAPFAMQAKIRPMTAEDIPGYHHCLDVLGRERQFIAWLEAPPIEKCRTRVLSLLERHMPPYVATSSDAIIGSSEIVPVPRVGHEHRAELGMGVLPEYRRLGVGSRLLQASLDTARQRSFERVELEVYAANQPAIRLYQKFGFKTEGLRKRGRKFDGYYDDVVLMVLFLDVPPNTALEPTPTAP
jgi:RimJ/RimL family protein N-acetyltransferase